MDFRALREDIPATRDSIYMNTGWSGPAPLRVLRRIAETMEQEALLGPASARGLAFTRSIDEDARQALATLLNASPGEVLLTHNTTEGINIVLHGLPWKPGDELLTCDLEHPALSHPASVLAERKGVRVVTAVTAPTAGAAEATEAIASAFSANTKLVALSHIQYTCGLRLPLREITALAHARGVPVLVDGAQTAGHIGLDMRDLGVDFYAISGQKWLLGPLGTGALYARKESQSLIEALFTTRSIEASRTFERPPLSHLSLASQSHGLVAGFAEGVRIAIELDAQRTEDRARQLAAMLLRGMDGVSGCVIFSPRSPETSCGLASLALAGWTPSDLVKALQERYRIVARSVNHPLGVRFSTAPFNTEQEVKQVIAALRTLTKERA